jgi:hypothetical protein
MKTSIAAALLFALGPIALCAHAQTDAMPARWVHGLNSLSVMTLAHSN